MFPLDLGLHVSDVTEATGFLVGLARASSYQEAVTVSLLGGFRSVKISTFADDTE
jgi:hypothetical protein